MRVATNKIVNKQFEQSSVVPVRRLSRSISSHVDTIYTWNVRHNWKFPKK